MKNKDGTVIYVPPPGTLLCLDPVGFLEDKPTTQCYLPRREVTEGERGRYDDGLPSHTCDSGLEDERKQWIR